jgi:hypothetical protein
MGNCASSAVAPDDPTAPEKGADKKAAAKAAAKSTPNKPKAYQFISIQDNYKTLEEVAEGLQVAGLESSNLVSFVCCTRTRPAVSRR